jgi:hypothetical protein
MRQISDSIVDRPEPWRGTRRHPRPDGYRLTQPVAYFTVAGINFWFEFTRQARQLLAGRFRSGGNP